MGLQHHADEIGCTFFLMKLVADKVSLSAYCYEKHEFGELSKLPLLQYFGARAELKDLKSSSVQFI